MSEGEKSSVNVNRRYSTGTLLGLACQRQSGSRTGYVWVVHTVRASSVTAWASSIILPCKSFPYRDQGWLAGFRSRGKAEMRRACVYQRILPLD